MERLQDRPRVLVCIVEEVLHGLIDLIPSSNLICPSLREFSGSVDAERKPADMEGLAAAKDGIRQQLLRQRQQAAAVSYMNYLKQRAQQDGALTVSPDAFPAT